MYLEVKIKINSQETHYGFTFPRILRMVIFNRIFFEAIKKFRLFKNLCLASALHALQ